MNHTHHRGLATLRKGSSAILTEFLRRPKKYESITGYLLEDSPECLLVELFNWDCFLWNGKCIVWKETLANVRPFDDSAWPTIAARNLHLLHSVKSRKSTEPLESFLKRHLQHGEIVLLEQERFWRDELFLCEILSVDGQSLGVRSYDSTLRKVDEVVIQYSRITKITFGDRYSLAARSALETMRQKRSGHSLRP